MIFNAILQFIPEAGWLAQTNLLLADPIEENPPPTLEKLVILRQKVDRNRLYI